MNYLKIFLQFSSVTHSVVSDSLRPHESQHARHPCPSPTPGVYSIIINLLIQYLLSSYFVLGTEKRRMKKQIQMWFLPSYNFQNSGRERLKKRLTPTTI